VLGGGFRFRRTYIFTGSFEKGNCGIGPERGVLNIYCDLGSLKRFRETLTGSTINACVQRYGDGLETVLLQKVDDF
jgi:hypothetical protein